MKSKNCDFCNFCDFSKNCEKLEKSHFLLKLTKSSVRGGRRMHSKNCDLFKNSKNWRTACFPRKVSYFCESRMSP